MVVSLLSGLLLTGIASADFAEKRILLKPAAGLSDEKLDKVLKKANKDAKSKRKLRGSNVHVIEVPAKSEKAIAKWLARVGGELLDCAATGVIALWSCVSFA